MSIFIRVWAPTCLHTHTHKWAEFLLGDIFPSTRGNLLHKLFVRDINGDTFHAHVIFLTVISHYELLSHRGLFLRDRKNKVESVIKRSNAIARSLEASASLSLLEATQRLLRATRRSVISAIKDAIWTLNHGAALWSSRSRKAYQT